MNTLPIQSIDGKKINCTVTLPGSKSITNRAFILAALANGKTVLNNALFSEDTVYMSKALKQIGIPISQDEKNKSFIIEGGRIPHGDYELFVGNAGTAMRFLTSYFCLGEGTFTLDGDPRMRERPIEDLLKALSELGARVSSLNKNGCPPVIIQGQGLKGGSCSISGKNSSQYISSILMAGPCSETGVILSTKDGVSSRPYIEMTLNMMERFGVKVERKDYSEFRLKKGQYLPQKEYLIEPDASSASYFLVAAAILGGKVTLEGLGKNSIQGDSAFIHVLEKMGCEIEAEENRMTLRSDGKLKGLDIDMNAIPDLVPSLAVAALFADSPTRIRNVANLRIKESDRIKALVVEMSKLGGDVKEYDDGLEIFPKVSYNNALISTYNDHRIAMSFSIAGLKISGLTIENPQCVSKSFPDFYEYLQKCFYE